MAFPVILRTSTEDLEQHGSGIRSLGRRWDKIELSDDEDDAAGLVACFGGSGCASVATQ